MNHRLLLVAALSLALLAAKSDPLAGRVAGPPQQCIDPSFADGPEVTDNGLIIYRENGRRWWVTRPVGKCPSLRPYTTLIIERWGSQLCRNDQFRTREANDIIPSAYCRFDQFVPYTKPGK